MTELSVVMPAFNEEATIAEAINRVLAAALPADSLELVVVENGSRDRTREILRQGEWPPEVRVLEIDVNRGKGGAVRAGAEAASGTFVAILDADLEYDPGDLAPMLEALRAGEADAVFGTRAWQSHSAFSYWYVIGNRAINTAANILYNVWLSDCMAGLKMMPTELFRSLDLRENGFSFEAEIVGRLLRRGTRVYEVPVTYRARRREEGKKLVARDGIRMLATFIRCRFA